MSSQPRMSADEYQRQFGKPDEGLLPRAMPAQTEPKARPVGERVTQVKLMFPLEPLSVNEAWMHVVRKGKDGKAFPTRIKSGEYRLFEERVYDHWARNGAPRLRLTDPATSESIAYECVITVFRKCLTVKGAVSRIAGDAGNFAKPVIDILCGKEALLGIDDSRFTRVTEEKVHYEGTRFFTVEIRPRPIRVYNPGVNTNG